MHSFGNQAAGQRFGGAIFSCPFDPNGHPGENSEFSQNVEERTVKMVIETANRNYCWLQSRAFLQSHQVSDYPRLPLLYLFFLLIRLPNRPSLIADTHSHTHTSCKALVLAISMAINQLPLANILLIF